MNIKLFCYLLVFLSRFKIIFKEIVSNLLFPYVSYFVSKLPIKIESQKHYIWFIYSSKYQYDLINWFLIIRFKINIYDKISYNQNISKLISLEIISTSNKNIFRYGVKDFNELKHQIFKEKLNLPHEVYLGSVSPFLFNDLLIYTFFRILKYRNILKFIDDGISGNIDNNRNHNLNFCPKKEKILTWNFKNYSKDKDKRDNKISFYKLLNTIKSESLKESSLVNSNAYKLIISSKYLDYDYLKNQILKSKKINKNLFLYIPHNKKWKNSNYLLKNCKLINTNNVEAWVLKNSEFIDEIYIGASATTLILGELKLLKEINSNINLCISNTINPNNSRKEFFSFLNSAITSGCYSNIYFDGKISKQI